MSHIEQKNFFQKIKNKFPDYFKDKRVLEIGSLNINGTVRDCFETSYYVGVDVGFGNGVDVVCGGENYKAPDNSFDVVCSAECFEHNPHWLETFQNMIRMCKDTGIVIFTCATEGRPEHGTTRTSPQDSPLTVNIGWDYYRNLKESDFTEKIDFSLYFDEYEFEVNEQSFDLYFWGIVKKKQQSIPVIGVPIVNGIHWIKRLINSIDYPVDELFIVNNNGRGQYDQELDKICSINHSFIKKIKVSHLPANIGCSGAWNLIIKCYMMSPYWIIVNHDVAFTPGFLEQMVNKVKNDDVGVVKPKDFQWDLFLIRDWVIERCGLFDENFYPAYMEDCDYHVRLLNENIKVEHLEQKYYHGHMNYENSGSQTLNDEEELAQKLYYAHDTNSWYMAEKWGPTWRNLEWEFAPWKHPYDKEDIPISYTKYDLKFVRRKNMGF